MRKKNIFIFTATRAEYGLLRWIIKKLQNTAEFNAYVIVGGTHLSKDYGDTLDEILADNIRNIIELPFLNASTKPNALVSSIGNGLIQISQLFSIYKPDFSFILGDRYELFIIAIASLMNRVPIFHLHGGEITAGVIDEQVRHALTKISHIHMASTEFYAENISKMGEEDWRIYVIGAPSLENIKKLKLYTKEDIKKIINVDLNKPTILCTYHPVTLKDEQKVIYEVKNLLDALMKYEIQIIFTRPNAEVGSDVVVKLIKEFIMGRKNIWFYDSLGTKLYLSIMKYVKAVVGNSSSGIIEAPSFHIPSINIGDRQEGRYKPKSVIDVKNSLEEISKGLERALFDKIFLENIKSCKNPYGDGNASEYILEAMKAISKYSKRKLLKKKLDFEVKKNEWHKYF